MMFLWFYAFSATILYISASKPKQYILTADLGTESCRVGIFNTTGGLISTSNLAYQTLFPRPGYAEQNPQDWYNNLQIACQRALSHEEIRPEDIISICIDTTACSVCILDEEKQPLRNCILWCDARAEAQTAEILSKGISDPHLRLNCNGQGPISAEWMIPKALWIKQNEPEIWQKSKYVCEKQDYMNYKLTGKLVVSGCNANARWHWIGSRPPVSLLEKIGFQDLIQKWPEEYVPMGEKVGELTAEAALSLGLLPGIPVFQGGPDAYVGMLGLGALEPGKMALITGSSHLHLAISDKLSHGAEFWGGYKDAPVVGLNFAEGGQSSTGSLLQWARRLFTTNSSVQEIALKDIDKEAAAVPAGAEGLLCLETFQGSRTPVTDPGARGALVGLSLFHSRGHIWRAMLEAICFGTRNCIEALGKAGFDSKEILMGGGSTRSPFFLQLHSDVTGLPVVVMEQDNAPMLGCAIIGAAGCNVHEPVGPSIRQSQASDHDSMMHNHSTSSTLRRISRAASVMVRIKTKILPNLENVRIYDRIFGIYKSLGPTLKELNAKLQRNSPTPSSISSSPAEITDVAASNEGSSTCLNRQAKRVIIVPSLLSADFGSLASEAALVARHCDYVHVDACDGGLAAPGALTVGPQTVSAIRRAAPKLKIDCHLVHDHPVWLIEAFAEAGTTRLTLQLEQLGSPRDVIAACERVNSAGMKCGLCLAPATDVRILDEILKGDSDLVEFVNILSVQPGVGGQKFDQSVLKKLSYVKSKFPSIRHIGIDGGINVSTVAAAVQAGANFIIAGSFIYGKDRVYCDEKSSENDFLKNLKTLHNIAELA